MSRICDDNGVDQAGGKPVYRLFWIRKMQWARMIAIWRSGVTGYIGACMSYFLWFRDDRIAHVTPEGSQGCMNESLELSLDASPQQSHHLTRREDPVTPPLGGL